MHNACSAEFSRANSGHTIARQDGVAHPAQAGNFRESPGHSVAGMACHSLPWSSDDTIMPGKGRHLTAETSYV